MRNKFRVAVISGWLAVSAVVAVAPEGAASTGAAQDSATIAGAGKLTEIRPEYPAVWVHFRPAVNSPAVELPREPWKIQTVCYTPGEGRAWNLVYDQWQQKVGYTYEEYLTVRSDQSCWNVGQAAGDAQAKVWVHLHPRADWAYEIIDLMHDVARICVIRQVYDPSDGSTRDWGLFVDHATQVAGFTWDKAVPLSNPVPSCAYG